MRVPAPGRITLEGDWTLPAGARGVVVFAHGSGSSRLSPRNRFVAQLLSDAGLATLLVDLLTREEEVFDDRSGALRFDIPFLARRLLAASEWVSQGDARVLPRGFFGASTGAAAALLAASLSPRSVKAVVSRGGRPDLARAALPRVEAATLLIVGERDPTVLRMNRDAYALMRCERRLEIVPGATHLFEEPGALEHVASSALAWFDEHLAPARARRAG